MRSRKLRGLDVLPPVFLCLFIILCFSLAGQVAYVGSQKLSMNINSHPLNIPYYANYSLDAPNAAIARAVIVIHGTNRDADVYFGNMVAAAALRPSFTDSLFIIAPQFLTEIDIDFHALDDEHLYWSSGGWKSGSNSRDEDTNPRPARIPSYAVLDSLMQRMILRFPNLQSVVLTGHSAGGQVTTRYVATSPFPTVACEQWGISTKFIVANPSSYLYLNNQRRVAGTVNNFTIPQTSCSDYNEWKYGLEELYQYPSSVGVNAIRNMMEQREVVYLLGENDNNPNSSSLDVSCAADWQGSHRLERGSIYFNYLKDYYGPTITALHSLDTVPNAGHSNFAMYTSDVGLFHLFEESAQTCQNTPVAVQEEPPAEFKLYPNPTQDVIRVETDGQKGSISLYNMAGVLVMETSLQDTPNQELSLRHLPPGSYVLRLRSGSTYWSQLVVKLS